MRNLHLHIRTEYDGESKKFFADWKEFSPQMADFHNHRHFTLRCLSEKVVPVSIKLSKSMSKHLKGFR